MTCRADLLPKATPAPRRNPPLWPVAQHCGSCRSGFLRGLPGSWGPTGVGRRKKVLLPLLRASQASTHQTENNKALLDSLSSSDCGKRRGGSEGNGREHRVIHNLSVTGRKSGLITHSPMNGIFLLSPGRAGPLVPSPIKWTATQKAVELINKFVPKRAITQSTRTVKIESV